MKLIFQYSPWLILLCVLLGALYAFLLYRKDRRLAEFPSALIYLISAFRFIATTFLAILLLSPLIKYLSRQIAEPILIIAQDQSESMVLTSDSSRLKNEFPELLQNVKDELSDNFQVEHYQFGERVRKYEGDDEYNDKSSNFEDLFDELAIRYENRNVGAILLITDGIFNRGMNPLYAIDRTNVPIYSVAIGDTNQRKDLLISNVINNKIAFLGNQFPIMVEFKAIKAQGAIAQLKILQKGKVIDQKKIEIEDENQFGNLEFLIKAENSGLQTYQILIESVDGEVSLENNSQTVYIDVLDSRQKILFLYQSPHPDIAAIQRSISSSENYKVDLIQVDKFTANLKSYDLIISHGLLSARSQKADQLIKEARSKELPILFFLDQSTNWDYLNNLKTAISASKALNNLNEVYPIYESAFPLFKLNEDQLNAIKGYPPLKVEQANYSLSEQVYVLLKQQIGSVPTNLPLVAFSQRDKIKEGVMVGEGYWRWRIDNYSKFGKHQQFDQLITKIIQYLSVKTDKSYFRISHEKEVLENEKLRFDLQLFNKAYDPINDPDAFLEVKDEEGNTYDYQFSKSSDAYYLELSGLNTGNYTYKAFTNYDQQRLEETGKFSISEIKVESIQLVADHNLLFQLAKKSGGKVYYSFDANNFKVELNARTDISSLSYTTEDVEDIINIRWIFFILLTLLSLEWFIRKYWGAY